jgi:hypothetical protein
VSRFRYNASASAEQNLRAIDRTLGRRLDRVVTTTYAIQPDDDTLVCDTTGGAFTATLPLITEELRGKVITFVTIANGVNALTIAASGGQTVNGGGGLVSAATYTPQRYQAVRLTSSTFGWVSV